MSDPNLINLPLNDISDEQFKTFFEDLMGQKGIREQSVVQGRVIEINDDWVMVDINYKAEGRIPVNEFKTPEGELTIKVGDMSTCTSTRSTKRKMSCSSRRKRPT